MLSFLLGRVVGHVSLELHIPERSALQSGSADSWEKSVSQSSDGVVGISERKGMDCNVSHTSQNMP